MTLGKLPTSRTEDIKKFDLKKLVPYLRRSSYRLYCAFHSATMVYPYDRPVEFEVSIGNYGNKLDSESPVQVSTTPPCNPTYDGKQYYYLPWMEQKPVVQVGMGDSPLMFNVLLAYKCLGLYWVDSLQCRLIFLIHPSISPPPPPTHIHTYRRIPQIRPPSRISPPCNFGSSSCIGSFVSCISPPPPL